MDLISIVKVVDPINHPRQLRYICWGAAKYTCQDIRCDNCVYNCNTFNMDAQRLLPGRLAVLRENLIKWI